MVVLAASSLGSAEAIWVSDPREGAARAFALVLDAAVGYAACALALLLLWRVALARVGGEAARARATAAAIPAGLLAACAVLARVDPGASLPQLAATATGALALGALVTALLRAQVSRLPSLGRARTWLAVQAALLAAAALVPRARVPEAPVAGGESDARPNVLLVTVDTLRADRVGAWGGRVRTPAIDRLAAEGVQFLDAVSPVPLTCPAHASILSGLDPTCVPSPNGSRTPATAPAPS